MKLTKGKEYIMYVPTPKDTNEDFNLIKKNKEIIESLGITIKYAISNSEITQVQFIEIEEYPDKLEEEALDAGYELIQKMNNN